jgi:predicted MPP superfamily phosphohydrolase
MLSGHTHGGQMFPFMAFVRLQQPVVSGLHELAGVLTYTSNGTGYWGPPFRIGPRGEVTVVTLRAA